MSKFHERYIKARPISVDKEVLKRIMSISVRPTRLVFIVNEDIAIEQILKLVEYNSMVWGGYYNLIIPTDGVVIRDDWFRSVLNHDADFLVVVGEVNSLLIEKIYKHLQPYSVLEWSDDFVDMHLEGNLAIRCLSVIYPLKYVYNLGKQNLIYDVRIPKAVRESDFYLYSIAQFGILPSRFENYCIEQMKGQYINVPIEDIREYLSFFNDMSDYLTPVRMTKLKLSVKSEFSGEFMIVLAGEKHLHDFCLFWNIRAQSDFPEENVVFVPASSFKREGGIADFAEFCNLRAKNANYIVIASASIDKEELIDIRDKIRPMINSERIDFIDLWFNGFVSGKVYVYEREFREEITVEDRFFRLKSAHPDFGVHLDDSIWVVDAQIESEGRKPIGFLPPKFQDLNKILSNNPDPLVLRINRGYRVRLSKRHLSYRVTGDVEFIKGFMPSEQEIFQNLLSSHRYSFKISDKCRYVQGMIRLMGGLDDVIVFRGGNIRNLMLRMDNEIGFTIQEMMPILRVNSKERSDVEDILADMAMKRVILRGYKISCAVCDLTRWYPVSDIDEVIKCEGCLNDIQLPIEAMFCYKLNELMVRGVNQGCIPVLLTILFLRNLVRESFMFIPGVIVSENSDIDIISSCEGYLVLAECKDFRDSQSDGVEEIIYSQILRMTEMAKRIGATVVFISTMLENVSEGLSERIDSFNKQLNGEVVVHLLTLADLVQGYKAREKHSDERVSGNMDIFDFLPRRTSKKDGWLRETGSRMMYF